MKHMILPFSALILILLAALAAPTSPALASPAALGVSAVSPGQVVNDLAVVLTVSGTDFVDGAVVSLDGAGALATTFISSTSLSAALPVNFAAGVYTVRVTNPDASSAALPNALVVRNPSEPTATPTARPAYERPLLVIDSYTADARTLWIGQEFNLNVKLRNAGQAVANNVVVTFTSGDLVPRATGGVVALGSVAAGSQAEMNQPLYITTNVWGALVSMVMNVTYTDQAGISYTDAFTLTFTLTSPGVRPRSTDTPTPTPTATPQPTQALRPQLVITAYGVDVEKLQPGGQFILQVKVQNVGSADAHRVTMISGGGSAGSSSGTPDPGGTSGGAGDFTNFAPLGSSNIQSLGEMASGFTLMASQPLIVNVNTNPGAYPFKISFTYVDDNNMIYTDDQVITLLVFSSPVVDINFYQPTTTLVTGQANMLPLQVVNLGRRSVVLGSMRVESSNGFLENNTTLVGALETGGYFTLDAMIYPDLPGTVDLTVYLEYTDDFNQVQVITKTLTLEVMEGYIPPPEEGGEGGIPEPPVEEPETIWQKIWRFILGLLGLDSGKPSEQTPVFPVDNPGEFPSEGPVEGPVDSPIIEPLPAPMK